MVDDVESMCHCYTGKPKMYGQFCEYNYTEFQDEYGCKCQNNGLFIPVANWITGCDCSESYPPSHGWYCEILDESLCTGNTVYIETGANPGDVTCRCKPGFFGDVENGCPHHCDMEDESTCSPGTYCTSWGEQKINECHCDDDLTCGKHGQCRSNTEDNAECDCDPGFMGPDCNSTIVCTDVTCQNGGKCSVGGSLNEEYCDCPPQYIGEVCSTSICDPELLTCGEGSCSLTDYGYTVSFDIQKV